MRRRILLVGATGAFGRRLARLLAEWQDIELVLAARDGARIEQLAADLAPTAEARISVATFNRDQPENLASLEPWAVVDAAGPFQASDLRLPRAAVAAGAHYVDIADARDFVANFPAALDGVAQAAGVLALTGASSTPALSNAATDELTRGWAEVATLTIGICPGARAPRGLSVVRAILSYVGQPVRVFADGHWTARPGWSGLRRVGIPGLGRRWAALCETPDLDLLPARFRPSREAMFLAGLEVGVMHLGLWALSWLVRLRLLRSLAPLAVPLRAAAGLFERFGSDRGGMIVVAEGRTSDGELARARWSLVAEANAGPTVPVAAAAAALRALKDERLTKRGARVCVGLLSLEDIMAELRHLPITSRLDVTAPSEGVFRQILGDGFDALPPAVARIHGTPGRFEGRARARGARIAPAWLLRRTLGVPGPGAYPQVSVTISPTAEGESWTRRFGEARFTSHLRALEAPGSFEERFGILRFVFKAQPTRSGFRWAFRAWRLGPLPLPAAVAPRIRARAFQADGGYRFRVLTAHPWFGVLFAYAGRLD